jgi:cytochrome P450
MTADRYNIWAPENRANPHPLYAQMRCEAPVYRTTNPVSGEPVWVFTRYDDCVTLLKDQRFGKEIEKHLNPGAMMPNGGSDSDEFAVINRNMLNVDPPDHTRLRGLVHKAFTPHIVETLRPRVQQIAMDLLDKMRDCHEADLLAAYAFPLPITVMAELLGVPPADRDRFRVWAQVLLISGDNAGLLEAVREFTVYIHALLDERRLNPRDDLISALLAVEETGDEIDRMELVSMVFLLLVAAGHETTANLIGNGTLALLEHPDQMRKLRDDPALISPAIEEMLRYESSLERATMRWAFEDVEIDGQLIPQGDAVMPLLLAANRDPAQFPDPDRFDITRQPNRHIAFGSGIHHCLGAPLARLEGAIAIHALLKALPDLRLNTSVDQLAWHENLLVRGMKALPVTY